MWAIWLMLPLTAFGETFEGFGLFVLEHPDSAVRNSRRVLIVVQTVPPYARHAAHPPRCRR